MADIPKIVQSRLAYRAGGIPGDHPDANLLAAFAERWLSDSERQAVAAHLAACADCRECLALAFATAEPEAQTVVHTARPARRWLPVWRWVAPVAMLSFILAVVWQPRWTNPVVEPRKVSAVLAPAPPLGIEKTPSPLAVTRMSLKPSLSEKASPLKQVKTLAKTVAQPDVLLKKDLAPKLETPPPLPAGLEGRVQISALSPADSSSGRQKPPSPGPASPAVSDKSQADALRQKRVELASDLESVPPAAHASGYLPQQSAATGALNNLAPAPPPPVFPRKLMRSAAPVKEEPAAPTALWSINASPASAARGYGVVQRSFDGGQTWQDVLLNDTVSFRAVATAGTHVWAGGTGGALFHSPDQGSHWRQVSVADGSVKLTDTITAIELPNPDQIKITAGSGERWISGDGGSHWKREP